MAARRATPAGDPSKAIAYVRVSTDKQEHGPAAQRAVLAAWSERTGVQIVETFEEEESGAADIADRPQLTAAIADLRSRRAGVFVAAKRDRLAREMVIARQIREEVRRAGGVLITADGMSDVEGRPDSFLREGISDLFAEHERRQIADRTRAALAAMKRKGLLTGTAPYGFARGPGGRLQPDKWEQAVCRFVMKLHAAGRSEREIEDALKAHRVKSRKGHRLAQTQVHRIIKNAAAREALLAAIATPRS